MYRRSFALWIVIFVSISCDSPGLRADASEWTPEDSKEETAADTLCNRGQLNAAEAGYREVLARHPDAAAALMYHVKGLDALGQFSEALPEAQKAVKIAPDDAIVQEWQGMTLVLSGRYPDAITALQKSLALKPDEETSSIWLAQAYLLVGNKGRSDQILEGLLEGRSKEQQRVTADRIANGFYQMGHSPEAVAWWLRSARLGSKDAAKWLAWAYSNAYGVPQDNGDSAYWSRRTDDPTFPWFPRLSYANKLVGWGSGYGLVGLILFAPILLPITTIGLLGYLFSRGVTQDPKIHWSEREAGIYPRALAKLYEVNLIPAVMPGKRKVHPHLYDRLLAAGMTPDFPRPKPPARWGLWAGLFLASLNATFLTAIWLLLF